MDDRNKKLWMTEHRREYEQKSPDDLIDIRDSCTDLHDPMRILAQQVLHGKDSRMQDCVLKWAKIGGVAGAVAAIFAGIAVFPILHDWCASHAKHESQSEPPSAHSQPQSAAASVPVISTPTPTNRQAQVPAPVFQTNKQNQDVRP